MALESFSGLNCASLLFKVCKYTYNTLIMKIYWTYFTNHQCWEEKYHNNNQRNYIIKMSKISWLIVFLFIWFFFIILVISCLVILKMQRLDCYFVVDFLMFIYAFKCDNILEIWEELMRLQVEYFSVIIYKYFHRNCLLLHCVIVWDLWRMLTFVFWWSIRDWYTVLKGQSLWFFDGIQTENY